MQQFDPDTVSFSVTLTDNNVLRNQKAGCFHLSNKHINRNRTAGTTLQKFVIILWPIRIENSSSEHFCQRGGKKQKNLQTNKKNSEKVGLSEENSLNPEGKKKRDFGPNPRML